MGDVGSHRNTGSRTPPPTRRRSRVGGQQVDAPVADPYEAVVLEVLQDRLRVGRRRPSMAAGVVCAQETVHYGLGSLLSWIL
ncbi:hypothetical protein [Streptomyces sp. NPDC002845]